MCVLKINIVFVRTLGCANRRKNKVDWTDPRSKAIGEDWAGERASMKMLERL